MAYVALDEACTPSFETALALPTPTIDVSDEVCAAHGVMQLGVSHEKEDTESYFDY